MSVNERNVNPNEPPGDSAKNKGAGGKPIKNIILFGVATSLVLSSAIISFMMIRPRLSEQYYASVTGGKEIGSSEHSGGYINYIQQAPAIQTYYQGTAKLNTEPFLWSTEIKESITTYATSQNTRKGTLFLEVACLKEQAYIHACATGIFAKGGYGGYIDYDVEYMAKKDQLLLRINRINYALDEGNYGGNTFLYNTDKMVLENQRKWLSLPLTKSASISLEDADETIAAYYSNDYFYQWTEIAITMDAKLKANSQSIYNVCDGYPSDEAKQKEYERDVALTMMAPYIRVFPTEGDATRTYLSKKSKDSFSCYFTRNNFLDFSGNYSYHIKQHGEGLRFDYANPDGDATEMALPYAREYVKEQRSKIAEDN